MVFFTWQSGPPFVLVSSNGFFFFNWGLWVVFWKAALSVVGSSVCGEILGLSSLQSVLGLWKLLM